MSIFRRLAAALLLTVATLAVTAADARAQGFAVVAHPDTPVASLSALDLSKIFLRQQRVLPGGAVAQPVELPSDSPVRAAFSMAVHGRPVANIERYWQGQIFAGGPTPPPRRPSDAEVLAFVRATPGAIGYVKTATNAAGVKVITIQ